MDACPQLAEQCYALDSESQQVVWECLSGGESCRMKMNWKVSRRYVIPVISTSRQRFATNWSHDGKPL